MSSELSYKAAYERQKKAREHAELCLERVSRELYESHSTLLNAFNSLKEQKAQLLHQEKLASIGQLSAGVAHEINNPAGYVLSNINSVQAYIFQLVEFIQRLETLALEHSTDTTKTSESISAFKRELDFEFVLEDLNEALDDSKEGLDRIKNIVTSLKGFARQDSNDKEETCLNHCIENTLKLVQSELKHKAELKLELADLPKIKGRPGELSQVILNLITNALDAIEKNGIITIKTEKHDGSVSFSIEDDGKGIDDEQLNIIFDPFFTTKEPGKGTGLGLSISHGIIQQHGGALRVASEKGRGTTFHFSLPLPPKTSVIENKDIL